MLVLIQTTKKKVKQTERKMNRTSEDNSQNKINRSVKNIQHTNIITD